MDFRRYLSLLIFVMTTRNDKTENQAAQAITWSAFCTFITPNTKMNWNFSSKKDFHDLLYLVENKIPKFILCRIQLLRSQLSKNDSRDG